MCDCDIIFAPGSASTKTEVAQFAVPQVGQGSAAEA